MTAESVQTVEPTAEVQEKGLARDAKIYQPSSFASRKAEAAAKATNPGMVRIGRTSHMMKDRRNQDIYVEGELFYEQGHPMRRWVRFDHDSTWHALFDVNSKPAKPEPIGTFSRKSPFAVSKPSLPDSFPDQP